MIGLNFNHFGNGIYWATESLRECEAQELPLGKEKTLDLQIASRFESSRDYRILFYSLGKNSPRVVMLNATMGRILDRKTINRYFRRYKPEYGNSLHSELARSMEYLNIFHDLEFGD